MSHRVALGIVALAIAALLVGCTGYWTGEWEPYSDYDEDSGVAEFQIGDDYIRVRFEDDSVYTYTYDSAGEIHVERMKSLANQGDGLNAYINQNVRYGYE